jgi:hypothetical protein
MGKPVPEPLRDLFDKPALAHLATLMPDGRVARLDSLSRKYMGTDYPYRRPGDRAVTYCIEPEHFTFMD